MRELPVFLEGFSLVCEYRRAALGDRCGRVILCRIDVARRPTDLGAERLQCFDQHRRLDRHVQAAGDAGAAERRQRRKFIADRHQPGHLGFGDCDFLAAPVGELEVRDAEVCEFGFLGHCIHRVTPFVSSDSLDGMDHAPVAANRGSTSAVAMVA